MVTENDDTAGISFEDSQNNVGDKYFMYIIDGGAHVSCFFWFSSSEQLLNSIMNYMDYWQWGNGFEEALQDLSGIILKHPDAIELKYELQSELSKYMEKHAGITLYGWGTFDDLCNSDDSFCEEIRCDFREYQRDMNDDYEDDEEDEDERDQNEELDDLPDSSRPISDDELDSFCDYLIQIPS